MSLRNRNPLPKPRKAERLFLKKKTFLSSAQNVQSRSEPSRCAVVLRRERGKWTGTRRFGVVFGGETGLNEERDVGHELVLLAGDELGVLQVGLPGQAAAQPLHHVVGQDFHVTAPRRSADVRVAAGELDGAVVRFARVRLTTRKTNNNRSKKVVSYAKISNWNQKWF